MTMYYCPECGIDESHLPGVIVSMNEFGKQFKGGSLFDERYMEFLEPAVKKADMTQDNWWDKTYGVAWNKFHEWIGKQTIEPEYTIWFCSPKCACKYLYKIAFDGKELE